MFNLLSLTTNRAYWKLHSRIIAFILRLKGVTVGRNFHIEGVPRLYIRGKAANISIGDNVTILGDIDIRNRHNGRLIIEDNVSIEQDCRFTTANDALLRIGRGCGIGPFCMFNCGASVTIGRDCLVAGQVHVQSSDHCFADPDRLIRDQGYTYGPIVVGDDVWLAVGATLLKGVNLGHGCVVAARAVVRGGDYAAGSILAGVPARVVGTRGAKHEVV